MTSFRTARLAKLRAMLAERELDALLVSQPENRFYLSGFTGSSGWLLISADLTLIATDFRYYEQAAIESPGFELVCLQNSLSEMLPDMLARGPIRRLAFEADHAAFADVQAWSRAAPDCEWVPVTGLVMEMRAAKDSDELSTLRAAIRLGDDALAEALSQARPGMTEQQLAWIIESYIRTHGAQSVAFDIVVACGASGARPHARATQAPLVPGEPIVIDLGARLDHYCSDLTRTVCLGEPKDARRFWEIYEIVRLAQQSAEAAIRPGMTGQEVDAIARAVIGDAGYGDCFGHGLGHGVGLAIHELPRLGRLGTAPLAPGNCVTVEPGVYVSGWGGVRLEDVVLVTDSGVEVLTTAPKTPIVPC